MQNYKKIKKAVEALLFAADESLSSRRLSDILDCRPSMIDEVIRLLKTEYDEDGRAFTIEEVNKGYRLYTREEYSELVKNLKSKKELYLSQAALTTLAIIAYRQPITRKEIEKIRGVDSSGVINTLQDSSLIKVVGKGEGFGHPYLYGTTDRFLEAFQINSLEELPEIEDEDSAFFGESGNRFEKKGSGTD